MGFWCLLFNIHFNNTASIIVCQVSFWQFFIRYFVNLRLLSRKWYTFLSIFGYVLLEMLFLFQEVNRQDILSCSLLASFFMSFYRQRKKTIHFLLYQACIQVILPAEFQEVGKMLLCSPTIQACPLWASAKSIGSTAFHSLYGMLSSLYLSELEEHWFWIPFPPSSPPSQSFITIVPQNMNEYKSIFWTMHQRNIAESSFRLYIEYERYIDYNSNCKDKTNSYQHTNGTSSPTSRKEITADEI